MASWTTVMRRAVTPTALASLSSVAALALTAQFEGKSAVQPLNATSHWLNGEPAADVRRADLRNTAVGLATHCAAVFFWAAIFERWLAAGPPQRRSNLALQAIAMSAIAAAVDYGATPKRFTPGWEFVLSKRSMAVVYAAMAAGLAAGESITQPSRGIAKPQPVSAATAP